MSMPPGVNDPHFILRRDYDRYSILVRTEHGNYETLLTIDQDYNWQPAADIILDALVAVDPIILPNPSSGSKP